MTAHHEWLDAQRVAAASADRAIVALHSPAVIPADSGVPVVYVHRHGSRLLATDLTTPGRSERVTPAAVACVLLAECPGVVVLPDTRTADELHTLLAADPSATAQQCARALELCLALASSRHVVVLTAALSRKFHMPAGKDAGDLADWVAATHFAGLGALEAIRRLYRAVLTGPGGLGRGAKNLADATTPAPDIFLKAARAEAAILGSLAYEGVGSECSRFVQATIVQAVWELVEATDPVRRDVSRADGTVCRATVVRSTGRELVCRVEAPFKLKPGKKVLVLKEDLPADPKRSVRLPLVSVTADADGHFLATFEQSIVSSISMREGETVEVVQEPFIPAPVRTPARWVSLDARPRPVRDVPLSVSLAGAPEEVAIAA